MQFRLHPQADFNQINTLSDTNFRLLTLGRLTLLGGEGEAGADALRRQRRKLAVLALLALERKAVARATLAEMFWGEQPEERARHSLSEALSHLRRVLGRDALAARGAEVVLAPGAPLVVDAREFAAAVRAERWSEALALWGGTFLEGVEAGGSRRLEAWIEGQQRELGQLFVRACEREHAVLRSGGRWDEAADVARRWVEVDPLSEAAALALLGALEAVDTPEADGRAFREYQLLRARLEREYGAEPGARVAARGAVLRERLEQAGAGDVAHATAAAPRERLEQADAGTRAHAGDRLPLVSGPPPSGSIPPRVASVSPVSVPSGGSVEVPGHPAVAETAGKRRRHIARWSAGAGALVLVAAALLVRFIPLPPLVSSTRIAVLPFEVRGPTEYAYLREGVVDLLSADLDGAGPFRTVDPQAVLNALRARAPESRGGRVARDVAGRLGAGLYVSGDVVAAGGRLRISATMFRPGVLDRPVADATVEGAPDDLFRLVDRLTVGLLAASGSPVPPLGRLAAVTTGSLPALKKYLEGEGDFRRGLYASAFEAFRAAADEDTTFALAHYRVAQAASWAVPPGWGWDSILGRSRRAGILADRLAPRARLLVRAYANSTSGWYDDAEQAYRAVVRTYPDDVEAWMGLGEVLFHTNPMRGRPFLEARPPFERVLALEPDNLSALSHLLRISLREGRASAVDSLVARLDALAPAGRTTEYHALRAFARGDEAERGRMLAELRARGDDELLRVTAHRVALFAGDLDGAARILPLLLDHSLAPDVQAHARIWLAQLEIAHGRWRAGESHLQAAAGLDSALALEQRALLAALPFGTGGDARAAAAEAALARWDGEHTPPASYPWLAVYDGLHGVIREYLLGLLELRRGDESAAERRAVALVQRGGNAEQRELARGLGQSLRAHAAARAGRPDALARFDAARLRLPEGLLESQIGSQAYERWGRAELLFRLGQWRQALPWYVSLTETSFIDGLIYDAPAELRQAQIYERLGDRRAAQSHYARFIELWRSADPELQPRVDQARARLHALSS